MFNADFSFILKSIWFQHRTMIDCTLHHQNKPNQKKLYFPAVTLRHRKRFLFQIQKMTITDMYYKLHSSFVWVSQLESAGRILKVTEARLEDSGRYTCLATNAAGEAQQHIRLSVHGNVKINTALPLHVSIPRLSRLPDSVMSYIFTLATL